MHVDVGALLFTVFIDDPFIFVCLVFSSSPFYTLSKSIKLFHVL